MTSMTSISCLLVIMSWMNSLPDAFVISNGPPTLTTLSQITSLRTRAIHHSHPITSLRAGALHHPQIHSLENAKLRIDGIHAYVFIAVLVMNASLRLFTSTPLAMDSLKPTCRNKTYRAGALHHPQIHSLENAKLRIDGIHAYVFIAVLVMNASLRLFTSTPLAMDSLKPTCRNKTYATWAFLGVISTTFFGSIYSSCVFALIELYARSSLGFGLGDASNLNIFMTSTRFFRLSGYHAFVTSLMSLLCSFPLSFYVRSTFGDNPKMQRRKNLIFSGMASMCLFIVVCWFKLIHLGGIIYR